MPAGSTDSTMAYIIRDKRISKDLANIKTKPPWGISCNTVKDGNMDQLEAMIMGPRGSPFEDGAFRLQVDIPEKYPFQPPQVKFITPVYHPNIDRGGRICLDLLKMPPGGSWLPTMTLEAVLLGVQALLAAPNPDNPLELDIAQQYKQDRHAYDLTAKENTRKHAI